MRIESFVIDGHTFRLESITVDPLGIETAVYARADGRKAVLERTKEERELHESWLAEDMNDFSIGGI